MILKMRAVGAVQQEISTKAKEADAHLRTVFDNKAPALRCAFPILQEWDVADMRFFGSYDRSLAKRHGIDYGLVVVERLEEVLPLPCTLEMIEALFQGAPKEALKDGFAFYFSRLQAAEWSTDCYRCRAAMPMLYKRLVRRPLHLLHFDVVRYFADFLLQGADHGWWMKSVDRHPDQLILDPETFLGQVGYTTRQKEEFFRLLADCPQYSLLRRG